MSDNWKDLYQYADAKGFPSMTYKNSVKASNVPKKLFEECIPRCFPVGAQSYNESMMKCASNCKSKTIESYQMFKGIYTDKLTDEGYVVDANSAKNNENPFEGMTENKRLMSAMKNFEIHTAPATPAYL